MLERLKRNKEYKQILRLASFSSLWNFLVSEKLRIEVHFDLFNWETMLGNERVFPAAGGAARSNVFQASIWRQDEFWKQSKN